MPRILDLPEPRTPIPLEQSWLAIDSPDPAVGTVRESLDRIKAVLLPNPVIAHHSDLAGLDQDDHPHYLTTARARHLLIDGGEFTGPS